MYLGRIVCAGMTSDGKPCVAYRVSSRSFPNRSAVVLNDKIAVLPRKGFESDLSRNPYIAYHCIRTTSNTALATNGSQTDPIIEKISMGYPLRDAFAFCMLAMDFEKDHLNTPRVSAAIDMEKQSLTLGIVRHDALLIRNFPMIAGKIRFVSTYAKDTPCDANIESFSCSTPEELAQFVISGGVFAQFEHAVTAAAAVWNGTSFEFATVDA